MIDALAHASDPDGTRTRLRSAVRRVIEQVTCVFVPATKRVRLAAVQIDFRGRARRHYVIGHRQVYRNQHGEGRPARTWSRSQVWTAEAGELDLRQPADARAVEVVLEELDVTQLGG